MIRLWMITFLVLVPTIGMPAPLTVRTGEHSDFTRLVISIPEGAEWRLGRRPEGYVLRLPVGEGYDLNGFFDLIPRDRITDVAQDVGAGELILAVDCLCNATAFLFRANLLVVDIRNGPSSRISPFELALPTADDNPATVSEPPTFAPSYNIAQRSLLPVIVPDIDEESFMRVAPERIVTRSGTGLETVPVSSEENLSAAEADELGSLAQAITTSIARGMTEGLLQGDLQVQDQRENDVNSDGRLRDLLDDALPGIKARTSVDPLAVPSRREGPQTQTGAACLPQNYFEVATWGNDSPFHLQINAARNTLVSEAGSVDENAVLGLAQLYVYFGFGKEAQQTLRIDQIASQERLYLQALAQLIDAEAIAPGLFDGQVSCPSAVALWALLAAPQAPADAKVETVAIIRAFRELPPQLQPMIAPRLSEKLLELGAQEAAMQVLGRVPAGSSAAEPDMILAEVALTDALGEEDEALAQLTKIVREGVQPTPSALIRFFDQGIAQAVQFSDEDFLLADALRFETAQDPVGVVLLKAQIAAYLSVDRFTDARSLIEAEQMLLTEPDQRDLRHALIIQAAERMADGAFLDFIWTEELTQDDAETQNSVATRLLALGFPERALDILIASAVGPAALRQRNLRTQATTALENARIALNRQDNGTLRPPSVSAEREERPASDDRVGLVSRGIENFEPDQPSVQDLPAASLAREMLDAQGARPLAGGRALLESSLQSRQRLDEVLQRSQIPVDF